MIRGAALATSNFAVFLLAADRNIITMDQHKLMTIDRLSHQGKSSMGVTLQSAVIRHMAATHLMAATRLTFPEVLSQVDRHVQQHLIK